MAVWSVLFYNAPTWTRLAPPSRRRLDAYMPPLVRRSHLHLRQAFPLPRFAPNALQAFHHLEESWITSRCCSLRVRTVAGHRPVFLLGDHPPASQETRLRWPQRSTHVRFSRHDSLELPCDECGLTFPTRHALSMHAVLSFLDLEAGWSVTLSRWTPFPFLTCQFCRIHPISAMVTDLFVVFLLSLFCAPCNCNFFRMITDLLRSTENKYFSPLGHLRFPSEHDAAFFSFNRSREEKCVSRVFCSR